MPDTAAPEPPAADATSATPAATADSTEAATSTTPPNNNGPPPKAKPRDYNPRWKGYVYIGIASLINFCSISNIPREYKRAYWISSMCFGVFTFALAILVLIQDRSQKCLKPFYYTKAKNGYFEGYTLCFSVVWWVIGVGFITRVNGIAYVANNIYFTAWLSLIACLYTLNEWSASKDILSIAELTGLSTTLKSWYLLCLSSIVVLGTSVDLHVTLDRRTHQDTEFSVTLGAVSTCVALFFILVHYNFFTFVEEGGWLELSSSFFLILLWIIGVALLTQNEGIAATLTGTQCGRDIREFVEDPDCAIVIVDVDNDAEGFMIVDSLQCSELPRQIPGSNMYFAVWTAFAASINISFRWKAAQALQFAQAQAQQAKQAQLGGAEGGSGEADNNNNNDIAQEGDSEDDEVDEDAI